MVKNIKFERVSPLQGRIEGPRSTIYQVIACTLSVTRVVKLALMWHIIVQNLLQCLDMIDLGHICPYITFLEPCWHSLSGLIVLRSKRQVSAKVVRNGP